MGKRLSSGNRDRHASGGARPRVGSTLSDNSSAAAANSGGLSVTGCLSDFSLYVFHPYGGGQRRFFHSSPYSGNQRGYLGKFMSAAMIKVVSNYVFHLSHFVVFVSTALFYFRGWVSELWRGDRKCLETLWNRAYHRSSENCKILHLGSDFTLRTQHLDVTVTTCSKGWSGVFFKYSSLSFFPPFPPNTNRYILLQHNLLQLQHST